MLCRVWEDEKFRDLSDNGKLLFLYYLTSPKSTPFLLYVEGPGSVADSLGWHTSCLSEAMFEVGQSGLIRLAGDRSNMVFLPNGLKQPENAPESPNAVKSWVSIFLDLPKNKFKSQCLRHWISLTEGKTHGMTHAFVKACSMAYPMGPVQEQEQEQEQDIIYPTSGDVGKQHVGTGGTGPDPEPDAFSLAPDVLPEKEAKSGGSRGLRHVGPDTPVEGLDEPDRCRRRFAIEWKAAERYNGTPYPDNPGADRRAAAAVLAYHRRNKLTEPWKSWVLRVFRAYLAIEDDRYIASACHPLSLIPRNLPRIVTAIKEQT